MNAVTDFTKLSATLEALKRGYNDVVVIDDPSLTFEGKQRKRDELRTEAKREAVAKATEIYSRFDARARDAFQAAEQHRPVFDQNNLAQLTRTRDAWEMNILPQLQSGRDWSFIMQHINRDDALAIERFAPSYVKSHAKMPVDAAETLSQIQAGLWIRHAKFAETEEGREAILNADREAIRANAAATIRNEIERSRSVADLTTASITLQHSIFGESN